PGEPEPQTLPLGTELAEVERVDHRVLEADRALHPQVALAGLLLQALESAGITARELDRPVWRSALDRRLLLEEAQVVVPEAGEVQPGDGVKAPPRRRGRREHDVERPVLEGPASLEDDDGDEAGDERAPAPRAGEPGDERQAGQREVAPRRA